MTKGVRIASPDPHNYPPALKSPFDLGGVNPRIPLLNGRAVLRKGKQSLALSDGRVVLSTRPSWGILFEGTGQSSDTVMLRRAFDHWSARTLSFPDERARGELYEDSVQLGGDFTKLPYTVKAHGELKQMYVGRARRLRGLLFHLPNFPNFLGSPISSDAATWRGRIELAAEPWRVVLDARQSLSAITNELRENRGFAITHVGRLDKGGAPFSPEEAAKVLTGLHWFLSFVRGAWTSPSVLIGETARPGPKWQHLGAGRTDPWSAAFRWCDWSAWNSAREAYQEYATLWSRPEWHQGLRVAIGLYISANKPNPVETAIIAAQSGLELLGWLRFVESRKVSTQEWRDSTRYPADRKIRELLSLASVDPAIPLRLSTLPRLNQSWKDGPAVVAGVRNRLVHPRRADGRVAWSGKVLVESWLLATSYLEFALLHALRVKSDIRNRLGESQWAGSTVKPPWSSE